LLHVIYPLTDPAIIIDPWFIKSNGQRWVQPSKDYSMAQLSEDEVRWFIWEE